MYYLDKKKLVEKVCLSMAQIDRLEKSGDFPKRFVLISRKVMWSGEEVDQWLSDMMKGSRESGRKPDTKPDVNLRWERNASSNH